MEPYFLLIYLVNPKKSTYPIGFLIPNIGVLSFLSLK
jgi:hypothetical protein